MSQQDGRVSHAQHPGEGADIAGIAQALVFLLGIVSIGHFVVINIMFQEWLWLIGGLLFLPVTAVLWPLVAWFFGLAAGPAALIFYVAAAVAIALQTNADRESYR